MGLRLACRSLRDALNIESLACCTDTNDARLDVSACAFSEKEVKGYLQM